jgi:hypothetical protein
MAIDFKNIAISSLTITGVTFASVLCITITVNLYTTFTISNEFEPSINLLARNYINSKNSPTLLTDNFTDSQINVVIFDEEKNKIFKLNNNSLIDISDSSPFPKLISVPFDVYISSMTTFEMSTLATMYNVDNLKIKLDIYDKKHIAADTFIMLLITNSLISHILYFKLVARNKLILKSLIKVEQYEYALSQRTTADLVSITHHKLNTPLKVLNTKSRMLIDIIKSQDNISQKTLDKALLDYHSIESSLTTISEVTDTLKSFNDLSKHELNLYKLFNVAKETTNVLNDDEFEIILDEKTKLFNIDKSYINSHEMIQIFINQINFSLSMLADKIHIKVFNTSNNVMILLYSDNGNIITDDMIDDLNTNNEIFVNADTNHKKNTHYDLTLNFIILNSKDFSNIKILSSNRNGNIFEIKLPVVRADETKKF